MRRTSWGTVASLFVAACMFSACDSGDSVPEDTHVHCDEERCYTLGMAFECSEDGRQLYQYIDPSDTLEMEFYKPHLVAGTNYIMHNCYDDTKCMINDKGFGGCFKPCGQQKMGTGGWCNQQDNGNHYYTEAKCELIDGQYVYNAVPHYSISSAIYSTVNIVHNYYCPDGRECKDDTGCVYYTAFDGQPCSSFDKASCIEEGGMTYAKVCKGVGGGELYFVASPCDFCKLSSDMTDAYCMEKCASEGQTKSVCENREVTELACVKQSDGQTYWASKQEKICEFGCDGDHCKEIPGVDEACDPAKYQSKCLDETSFLYCALASVPILNVARTWVADCGGLSSYFGREHICVNGENAVGCVPKDHSYPCQVEGQKIERCYQNEPGSGGVSSAFVYEMVCMKLPDGSLQYALPNSSISYYCQDRGYSDACNSGGTGCK